MKSVRTSANTTLLALQVAGLAAFVWTATDVAQERWITVGDKAPAFAVKTDDGRELSRDQFGGRLLVLNFWATWCPPCLYEMPSLSEFARTLESRGVVVLAVSIDEQNLTYRQFLDRLRPVFLTSRVGGDNLASEFGTSKVPETYIIDRKGRVLRKYVDARDWMNPEILRDVQTLLQ